MPNLVADAAKPAAPYEMPRVLLRLEGKLVTHLMAGGLCHVLKVLAIPGLEVGAVQLDRPVWCDWLRCTALVGHWGFGEFWALFVHRAPDCALTLSVLLLWLLSFGERFGFREYLVVANGGETIIHGDILDMLL